VSKNAVVVGAGVTGAATARALATRGWRVTLVEQYSPGTIRSASGGDTRLLRAAHGEADWYTGLAWRARSLWLELQEETATRIWEPVGLAWLAHRADGFEQRSLPSLERHNVPYEWILPDEARTLYPTLSVDDLHGVLLEPDAGVLHARRATQLLVEDGERRGVVRQAGRAAPDEPPGGDVVVWACGAWLPGLFPALVPVVVERRDVFFLGCDAAWTGTPGWVDYDAGYYGHGDLAGLGFKVAPDFPGEHVDPDTLDRIALPARQQEARDYAASRFPGLASAPVIGARVCQYDLSPDTHFVVAQHPERASWWLVGGGSGHGYKHGPALADYVADCIEEQREPEAFHALAPRSGDAGLRTGTR
jgi:glycine/D-amino acid oxidase-like deaminating enzyme